MSQPRSIDSQPRLSEGPTAAVTVKFGPRELEFIQLRYGQALPIKVVAERMGIELRTVKYYSYMLLMKFSIYPAKGKEAIHAIEATKLLVKHGFIQV